MRNDLAGTSLIDNSGNIMRMGCPNTGCIGYELTADIDFDTNGNVTADSGDLFYDADGDGSNNGWLPIGNASTPFTADFDGNGFTISNFFVNRPATDAETLGQNIGLFGYAMFSTIGNVEFTGSAAWVNGSGNVGVLLGYGEASTLENATLDIPVNGVKRVGSAVGRLNRSGNIINIVNSGDVIGTEDLIGGIAGDVTPANNFLSVRDCENTAKVSGRFHIGGLIGGFDDNSTAPSNNTVLVENNFTNAVVEGNSKVGGLVGLVDGNDNLELRFENNSTGGTVTGVAFGSSLIESIGGSFGSIETTTIIRDSVANGEVTGSFRVGGFAGRLIGSVEVYDSRANGNVDGDINVGGFVGVIETSNTQIAIVSNAFSNGDVTSVIPLLSSSITGGRATGGLVGEITGGANITNSYALGNVTSDFDYVGGLIGFVRAGSVRPANVNGSYATGDVEGNDFVGGLIGSINFIISPNETTVNISSSFSTGLVDGNDYVGGLIGISYNASHSNTFATSPVTGNRYVGGLIGDLNESMNVASLSNSYSVGSVSANLDDGGLIGYNRGATFSANFFATDNSGQSNAIGTNDSAGGVNPSGTFGDTLADLQAAISPGDTIGGNALYSGWSELVWLFTGNMQLPGLIYDGSVSRDSDGDGTLD